MNENSHVDLKNEKDGIKNPLEWNVTYRTTGEA